MKRFPLLSFLPLVAVVFAVACTDSTAPANSRVVAVSTGPLTFGDPPPPPVDVVMQITISSPGSAIFTGVFFSNGKISDDGLVSEPTFDGTAWLRLDNKQPTPFGTASPNARFMVKNANPPTGMGTITFVGDATYKIVRVDEFTRFNSCGAPLPDHLPTPCAIIRFTAEVVGVPCDLTDSEDPNCHHGHLEAFDRATCFISDHEGGFFFDFSRCGSD